MRSAPQADAVSAAAPPPVADEAIDDLRRRIRATRLVAVPGISWSHGTDPECLQRLLAWWADDYDWRIAEARIRRFPWVRAAGRRLLEQVGPDGAPVVVLLHGWPDSVLRFERVLPLLPEATVVVPALPGFPFSESPGSAPEDMAALIAEMLLARGHEHWILSGGDVGADLAMLLAQQYPDRVDALHLTDVGDHIADVPGADRTQVERELAAATDRWYHLEGGYAIEQATKPSTLAVGLGDSPAGLAAWIIEKLRSWSDCGGQVESVFRPEDILTWVSAYWFTGTIGTSFAAYDRTRRVPLTRLAPPAVISRFAADPAASPRAHVERFLDVRVWDEQPAGGHFAAWERPEAFAGGVCAAIAVAGRNGLPGARR